ncbi:hypothetical protein SAMN04488591_0369 [Microbacterium azadirachtae]|uniref:Uncharacterized protein n=1 Tax=Microbacterium azadirachtae TaxID=582680 RepID=A0A1I6FV59_9MICO|nr:hypothetical protein [Microbacterium azadirachtae]SFR33776.1 hypothetical protein SAMN04488591_0369 [Microbacterium azadirachtae]
MASWAEFEEKEFETLANAALVMQQLPGGMPVQLFSPGQVLEKTLGFDFATYVDPLGPLYRALFGATPGAPGVRSGPFPSRQVPTSAATGLLNVFLQYKRPQFFDQRHRSKVQPSGQPHLAFMIEERSSKGTDKYAQVGALDNLEVALQSQALVRYVCPSTWQKHELYRRFSSGELLTTSAFVAPRLLRLASQSGYHRRWTFLEATPGRGIPNPEGIELPAETGVDFTMTLTETRQGLGSPRTTTELFASATERTSTTRGSLRQYRKSSDPGQFREHEQQERRMRDEVRLTPQEHQEIVNEAVSLALVARDLRIQWMIAAAPDTA